MNDLCDIEKTIIEVVDKLNIYNRCFLTDEEKKDMIKEYKYMINNGNEDIIINQLRDCKEFDLIYKVKMYSLKIKRKKRIY